MLTRYRMQLMGDRTRETVRLELMLEDASIKLSSVASSLKTVSARAMLTAMIAGLGNFGVQGGTSDGAVSGLRHHRISILRRCRSGQVAGE